MYNIEQNDINLSDYWTWRTVRKWSVVADDDDKQNGREALCIAAEKWKPEKGEFWSFAPTVIRRNLYRKRFGTNGRVRGKADIMSDPELGNQFEDDRYNEPSVDKRTAEDFACDMNEINKAIKTMHPNSVYGLVRKVFYDEDYVETDKAIGVGSGVTATMILSWRNYGRTLNGHKQQQKYWGEHGAPDIREFLGFLEKFDN